MRTLLSFVATVALSACGGGSGTMPVASSAPIPTPVSSSPVVLGSVVPSSIEIGTSAAYDAPEYFGPPEAGSKNKLFVFFPGTRGVPGAAQDILREGAARGYYVIGLSYVNGTEVDQYCATASDPTCWGNVRSDVVYGDAASSLLSVTPADSIVGRLSALLSYLSVAYPGENWGQFVNAGAPVWSKIVAGGHSQGAGHAAFLAKSKAMAGVCAFDSPDDGNAIVASAGWLSQPSATAAMATYGFTNQDDAIAPFAGVTNDWSLLGIPGPAYDVDGRQPPYDGNHQLYTVASSNVTSNTHGYTVLDADTPTVNGVPVFAPVWDTMCFE